MEHIAGALVINLDKRPDRLAEFQKECKRMDINVERFPAIEETPGFIGCYKSHLAALKLAKSRGWQNVLIFEDDFQFVITKKVFETQMRAFFTANIPYDVLMLSYCATKSEPYNDIVKRIKDAQTTSGYIVHSRFYDTLIHHLEGNMELCMSEKIQKKHSIDIHWKTLQPHADWFGFCKRIGIQRPSYSDIENKFVNYMV